MALIAFPEAFVPAYPDWVWRSKPWDDGPGEWYARLLEQSVVLPSPATDALGDAARRAAAYVSIGVNERDPSGTTLYNTQVYFGPDGRLLGKHRKYAQGIDIYLAPTWDNSDVWEGIVTAELDVAEARIARRQMDPMGHYARPDVFRLSVDTAPEPAVTFGEG